MDYQTKQQMDVILSRIDSQCGAAPSSDFAIPLGISGRHVHLSKMYTEILFGTGYTLNIDRPLSQPGQFAAKERVCIAGPKGSFANVCVLGPFREHSQIEISRSDARALGINPPVRMSGELAGSADLCVIGSAGNQLFKEKIIIARRHIHMTPQDASRFGVSDGDVVSVESSGVRACTFHGVVIRVSADFRLELHLDTDEACAADLECGNLFRIAGKR